MIAELLPAGICGVDCRGDYPDAMLLCEEETALGRAAEGRKREFVAARVCARRALSRLGYSAEIPILRGPQREPIWPEGVVGSITHCQGYCAAAATTNQLYWSLGIDAEPNAPLPEGVLDKVALPAERSWIDAAAAAGICWDRLIFSAKESVYKAWFPIARRWLGFLDARIEFDGRTCTFEAHLLYEVLDPGGAALRILEGRFLMSEGLLLTFVGVPK